MRPSHCSGGRTVDFHHPPHAVAPQESLHPRDADHSLHHDAQCGGINYTTSVQANHSVRRLQGKAARPLPSGAQQAAASLGKWATKLAAAAGTWHQHQGVMPGSSLRRFKGQRKAQSSSPRPVLERASKQPASWPARGEAQV
eukprot:7362040-Alexandrium_andersonii.AAC.7